MTTEIAIMNREAVTLAADSAVTIVGDGDERIFESVQKLFPVSMDHPVGVMVYNNGSFMGIPWETIISTYRAEVGTGKCNTLGQYGKKMITILNRFAARIPQSTEERYLVRVLKDLFDMICRDIKNEIKAQRRKVGKKAATRERVRQITLKVIGGYLKKISASADISVPVGFDKVIDAKYGNFVTHIARAVFRSNQLRLSESSNVEAKLRHIGTEFFCKDTRLFYKDGEYSGLVIAGFGEKELFPSVTTFHIKGSLQGVLIYQQMNNLSDSVNFDRPAAIIPFAQGDVIDTFKYGIRPAYKNDIQERLTHLSFKSFKGSMRSLVKLYETTQATNQANLSQKLARRFANHFVDVAIGFEASVKEDERRANRDLEYLISALPKSELAEMAETLVSFTCFYRKFKGEEPTVRKPVDVAIVSKYDGFVWIKKKDYLPRI